MIGDKGYDSDEFVKFIVLTGAEAVIPPRKNRINPRPYDKFIYKARNLVERFFLKVKNFRRIATRFERMALTYEAMVSLAAAFLWTSN